MSALFPLRIFIFSFVLAIFSYAYAQEPPANKTSSCPSCGNEDKLTAVTDAKGNKLRFEYDLLGRLIKEINPLGNIISYSYDSVGNLIKKKDLKENATSYTYNKLRRLTKKVYPDASTEEFKYDSKGNIIYVGNQHIAYNLGYDAKNRLIWIVDSSGKTIKYEYDLVGNLIKMITPEEKIFIYAYDSANRLISITSEGKTFTFEYNKVGKRIKMTYPNGVITTYGYDRNGRLIHITHLSSDNTIDSFNYTYDNVGNLLSKTERYEGATYTYDGKNRLIKVLQSKLKGKKIEFENKSETFTYDPTGNRLSGPNKLDIYYEYNQFNQLHSDGKHQYRYDANGALLQKIEFDDNFAAKGWTYEYDYENRLVKVVKNNEGEIKTVTFKYDPFGRKIEKRIEEIEDGRRETKTFTYVYDHEDLILEYLTKTEGNEIKTEVTRYIHGFGIDEPLAIERKGELYYYHADSIGSIVALTNSRQRVVESYTYSAFGELKRHGDKIKNEYTFTGRIWDDDIKLYDYRQRHYDATIGRFTTRDPLNLAKILLLKQDASISDFGGELYDIALKNPQILNEYVYAINNPLIYRDPFGLQAGSLAAGWGFALAEPTFVGEVIMTGITVGVIGYELFSKQSKESQKERATDIPSWTNNYPRKPGENCKQYAERILNEKYGCGHPQSTQRGPNSEYSKIKKHCERG